MKAISGAWSLGVGGGSELSGDSAGRFGELIGLDNGVVLPGDVGGAGPL